MAELCRGALRQFFSGIGADQRRDLGRQPFDPLDALALRAELLVEHDLLEFRQPVFQLRLQVGLIEELRIAQPRADHALVAGDDGLAAVGRFEVRRQDEALASLPVFGSRTTKHFWLLRMVARITSPGMLRKLFVERAHQHHRPFDEARDLLEQRLVLDQLEALREGELLRVGEDDVLAPLRIEHDLRRFQLGDVIVEPAHRRKHPAP